MTSLVSSSTMGLVSMKNCSSLCSIAFKRSLPTIDLPLVLEGWQIELASIDRALSNYVPLFSASDRVIA